LEHSLKLIAEDVFTS